MIVLDVQRLLAAAGYYSGELDGDAGPKTLASIDAIIKANAAKIAGDPGRWTRQRRMIAAAQLVLEAGGCEPGTIDGYDGDNTREALRARAFFEENGHKEILPQRAEVPAAQAAPAVVSTKGFGPWPRQAECASFYGAPGNAACTDGVAALPVPFRIAWDLSQKVRSFRCHAKVAGAFTSIHAEAARHYGETKLSALKLDVFGGCYNLRKMRGGSAWSMHSWGIAEDLDPERNQLRMDHKAAAFAKSDYVAFWNIVEAHGAVSLGRARDFDWMHFQFARL